MISIYIDEPRSDMNLAAFRMMYREEWELNEISISYNPSKGLPNEQYPVKLKFQTNSEIIEIRIHTLTVGYGGTGPHDTASLLDFLGIKYDDDDIFSKKKAENDGTINLLYKPEVHD